MMDMHNKKFARKLLEQFETIKGQRKNWDSHWNEIAPLLIPRKDDVWRSRTAGEKRSNQIYDATAIHSNELLASALHGMLSNPATKWFELTTGEPELDERDDVRLWLQKTEDKMHAIINNSNFHSVIHETYLDLGAFGTGTIFVEEDKERIVHFKSRPIWEVYISENSDGIIDTFYHISYWKIRQIIQAFGEDNLPDELKRDAKVNPHKEVEVVHCVIPREEVNELKGSRGMPWASYHVIRNPEAVISESGFREFPGAISRWTKTAGEMYGRSPAMKSLPDIKMINQVMKTTIRSAQKTVDPPMIAVNDGILLPLNINPGGFSYKRPGTETPEPLFTGSRVDFGFQMLEQLKLQIRQAFFIDQLQLNEGPQMTATEVAQRTEEKLRLLGPILGRQQFELLRPIIDRIFAVCFRKKQFGESPEVLSGKDLQVRYSSQIAKAQRLSDSQNLQRALEIVFPLAQAKPDVLDNFNFDQIARDTMKVFGNPQTWLVNEDELNDQRQAAAEAEAQAQAQEQAMMEAEMVGKAGPTLLQANEQGA
jgi:hypothetical protein